MATLIRLAREIDTLGSQDKKNKEVKIKKLSRYSQRTGLSPVDTRTLKNGLEVYKKDDIAKLSYARDIPQGHVEAMVETKSALERNSTDEEKRSGRKTERA